MDGSKDWREHSDGSGQSTHTKYWVTLGGLGIGILVAICIAYIMTRTPPPPQAFLIYVDVEEGGQQREIPFQAEDREALESVFSTSDRFYREMINDAANFMPDQIASNLQIEEKDTVFVYVSAIGSTQAGTSYIKSSESGAPVGLEEFLNIFQGIEAKNKILILDCGHDFADISTYVADPPSKTATDFNRFVEQLDETMNDMEGQDVWVISTSGLGEIPLYSINRRRTLFNEAFTTVCRNEHQNVWDFYEELCRYCVTYGGQASQKPLLFRAGLGLMEIPTGDARSVMQVVPPTGELESAGGSEESTPIMHPLTADYLKQVSDGLISTRDQALADYRAAGERWPGDLNLQSWSSANRKIAEQVSRVKNTQKPEQVEIPMGVRDAREFNVIRERLGLSAEDDVSDSQNVTEREEIFEAFRTWQTIRYRSKFYVALFDSLSWLMSAEQLQEYQTDTSTLLQRLAEHQDLFSVRQIQLEKGGRVGKNYKQIASELKELDDRLRNLNKSNRVTRNQIEELTGVTREMVYAALLTSPLFEAAGKEGEKDRPRLWGLTREAILKGLETTKSGTNTPISQEQRLETSGQRKEIYLKLVKVLGSESITKLGNETRVLDPWAYYMPFKESELANLQTIKSPIQSSTSSLVGLADYRDTTTIVNISGQIIDLQFEQKGPAPSPVRFIFSVPRAGFELYDPAQPENGRTEIELSNSARFGIRATKELTESEKSDEFSITCDAIGSNNERQFPDQFDLPIRLPRKDEIQVEAKIGKNAWQRITRANDTLIKSLPNRPVNLELRVLNIWHGEQPVRMSLYGCLAAAEQLPGEITDTVRKETRRSVQNGTKKPLFSSAPMTLPPFRAGNEKLDRWEPILWTANAELQPGDAIRHKQGFVLVIDKVDEEGKTLLNSTKRYYWIENFPQSETLVSLEPETIYNEEIESWQVQLKDFKLLNQSFLDTQLSWSFSDNFSTDRFPAGEQLLTSSRSLRRAKSSNKNPVRIADNIDKLPEDLLFFVDVDGWPRKQAYICSMTEFKRPKTADLNKVHVTPFVIPNGDNEAKLRIKKLESQESDVTRWGVKSDPGNCELDFLFEFYQTDTSWLQKFGEPRDSDETRPYFQINVGGEAEQFFYPRDIWSEIQENPDVPGSLVLTTRVADFRKRRSTTGTTFNINTASFTAGPRNSVDRGLEEVQMNPLQIVFDKNSPAKLRSSDFRFLSQPPFRATQPIPFEVTVKDDGVGFDLSDDRSIRYFFAKKRNPDPLTELELTKGLFPKLDVIEVKGPAGLANRITLKGNLIAAPEEKGDYYLFFRIEDQVGNWSTSEPFKLEVIDAEAEAAAMQPKKYELVINAMLNGRTDWDSSQEAAIRVVIDPPVPGGSTVKRVDGKYTFYGLESGIAYEVKGIFAGIPSRGLEANEEIITVTNATGKPQMVLDLDISTR